MKVTKLLGWYTPIINWRNNNCYKHIPSSRETPIFKLLNFSLLTNSPIPSPPLISSSVIGNQQQYQANHCTTRQSWYRPFALWRHICPYTSVWWPPFWAAEMHYSDWEKGANRIALHQRKWLLQQDSYIPIYVLVSYKIYKSCWSSHLHCRRAIWLAPFSQSLQYISATQNGGHHTDAYECDVTTQKVYTWHECDMNRTWEPHALLLQTSNSLQVLHSYTLHILGSIHLQTRTRVTAFKQTNLCSSSNNVTIIVFYSCKRVTWPGLLWLENNKHM